jgi:type 1 glutamine amidotransferase/sugar phosphate isomerase/epimerase
LTPLVQAADAPAAGKNTAQASDEDRIEAALPKKALVAPRRPRKLLIFDVNVGYGGHPSRFIANMAFTMMGKKTGAFTTVISRDPSVFKPGSLRQYDAVFLNNTVGNLFEEPSLRQSLIEFIYGGGGLLGVHGTSVAFTRWTEGAREDWPEFAIMLGTRGAFHRASTEHVFIKLDDPDHPVCRPFGAKGFDYRDEFFRPQSPYSRHRDRVLLSIDTDKTDLKSQPRDRAYREDNDYALAWVRQYGRGRVFYSTIAHNSYVFWDAKMLEFYLAAAQFALGDLPAPTTPSAKLTPAVRAQEQLGWRLGIETDAFGASTLSDALDQAARLGVLYVGGVGSQKVSSEIAKDFGPQLTDKELEQVRLKLDSSGVFLLSYSIGQMPADAEGCRKLFEFGRKMGIETFVTNPSPDTLDALVKLCDQYDISVAIGNHDHKVSPHDWRPEAIVKACQGRTQRIGACGDIGHWIRSGIDPLHAVGMLKGRLIDVHLHEMPGENGLAKLEKVIQELHRLGVKPVMFASGRPRDGAEPGLDMARIIDLFHQLSLRLAKPGTP